MTHSERSLGRRFALLYLFGLDFTRYDAPGGMDGFWEMDPVSLLADHFDEGEEPLTPMPSYDTKTISSAKKYASALILKIVEEEEELDAQIAASLEKWSPERVGRVERIILRIALHEMKRTKMIPSTVAISEAVNMAKEFGSEDSYRFINGVLDRIKSADDIK